MTSSNNVPIFTGPVAVDIVFYLARPKTVKRVMPHTRPDLDQLSRAVLDALPVAGVWVDDAQVVNLHAVKVYADSHPCCLITVTEAT